jgi:hypothetical protein
MVLIDERGNELWLSGTPCGYGGEGPTKAERILRQEGFGEMAETVCDGRLVRVVLRKDGEGAVTSQVVERGTTLWDGGNTILRWLWRRGRIAGETDRATEAARLTWKDPFADTPVIPDDRG